MQQYIFICAIFILTSGLFVMITSDNYIKKIIGLGIFQSSVLIFYIALGKVNQGIVPIDICMNLKNCSHIFSNPLPHVLMLTAIVVGFATMAVGFALIKEINKQYGTISEQEILAQIQEEDYLQ
ncbi:MAG: cation:proton antiporter subunit C [Rickettsiaceae bacterium]|nr:cation:proton antiporter subunit C [Rickettsiaceae bacterium]